MYTPLKITTDYTLLGSLIKIDDLITFCSVNNISACGICDDNLFGVLEFYIKCKNNNIKPIIGLSIKLNDNIVYLYAKNYEGYKALIKINTIKYERDISILDIKNYWKNLIIILPFKSKDLFKILNDNIDLYIGYSNEYEKRNSKLLSEKCVFINDIRCLKVDDLEYLNYLDLIGGREKESYENNYYLKNNNLVDLKEIEEIINKINIEIPFNQRYIPIYNKDVDSFKFLYTLAHVGLKKRRKGIIEERYEKRLNYELEVIKKMGFVDYFLIVYDYVLYAKKNKIMVSCRGSAVASLVSYAIGITNIDPLKYNLLFERFLNPARVTMPDIDIDFDALKRDEVIKYVKDKYGINNVANGLTFTTMKSKLVLREVAKVLKVNNSVVDEFLKVISAEDDLKTNLEKDLVKRYLNRYSELKKVYKVALKLENLKRNTSMHASAIVIASEKIEDVIPIHYNDGLLTTGVTMDYLENLGLLKMDFLGLKNLSFIAKIKNAADIDLDNIDLEDKKVFEVFNRVDVDGIFQFETPAMKKFLMKFKIDAFKDLIAALALVRPGPKDYIDTYIRRKKNIEKTIFLHPVLEPILKETYGIILYQEQIMAILRIVAGYSLAEADIIRRAIAKKKEAIINEKRLDFINRAIKNNYSREVASKIYEDIVKFASYGFNKAHSVSYALFSYQMAYLKTYYYEYFMLNKLEESPINKVKEIINDLKLRTLKIIKPSVNYKNLEFEIKDKNLILPLRIIKGFTKELAKKIIELGPYEDYFAFLVKTNNLLDRGKIEVLIKSGALDCFKYNHPTLLNNLDNTLNYVAMNDTDLNRPQMEIFKDLTAEEKRLEELDCYGFYVANHPASIYTKDILKIKDMARFQFKKVKMVVLVTRISKIKTKDGLDMAFMEGTDETGKGDFTIFPKVFELLKDIKVNDLVFINGEVSKRFDKLQIIVNNIKKVVRS